MTRLSTTRSHCVPNEPTWSELERNSSRSWSTTPTAMQLLSLLLLLLLSTRQRRPNGCSSPTMAAACASRATVLPLAALARRRFFLRRLLCFYPTCSSLFCSARVAFVRAARGARSAVRPLHLRPHLRQYLLFPHQTARRRPRRPPFSRTTFCCCCCCCFNP